MLLISDFITQVSSSCQTLREKLPVISLFCVAYPDTLSSAIAFISWVAVIVEEKNNNKKNLLDHLSIPVPLLLRCGLVLNSFLYRVACQTQFWEQCTPWRSWRLQRYLVQTILPWHLPPCQQPTHCGDWNVTVTIETAARIRFQKVKRSWELER